MVRIAITICNVYDGVHVPYHTRTVPYRTRTVHVPYHTRTVPYAYCSIHVPYHTCTVPYAYRTVHIHSSWDLIQSTVRMNGFFLQIISNGTLDIRVSTIVAGTCRYCGAAARLLVGVVTGPHYM